MQLYFAGADLQPHLDLLRECNVTRVGVNMSTLLKTKGKATISKWATADRVGGLDWGIYADNPNVALTSILELLESAEVEPEFVAGPISWYRESPWFRDSDIFFVPLWDGFDRVALKEYAQEFNALTLPDLVVDNPDAVLSARSSLTKFGTLVALTGKSRGAERFDSVVSSAWWQVQKHGETQIWTGNRLRRLNNLEKHTKRQQFASAVEALGCNVSAFLMDDLTEGMRVAIKSWQAFEAFNALPTTIRPISEVDSVSEPSQNGKVLTLHGVASSPQKTRQDSASVLPVLTWDTVEEEVEVNGEIQTVQRNVLGVSPNLLLQCNTCILSQACPSFCAGASCSYQIPVSIRSKEDMHGVFRAVTEIQTQRIFMGRFAEQLAGEADPNLGKEMDRLFTMVEKWRAIEDDSSTLSLSIKAKGGNTAAGSGLISQLFGSRVGQEVQQVQPMLSTSVIEVLNDDE